MSARHCVCNCVGHWAIHDKQILQRDIKPTNILIQVQPLAAVLSALGCSRALLPRGHGAAEEEPLTPDMVTLWCRAPDIFLCHSDYHFPSDVWSLGITFAEIEQGSALFPNDTQICMLFDIFKLLAVVRLSSGWALWEQFCSQASSHVGGAGDRDMVQAFMI